MFIFALIFVASIVNAQNVTSKNRGNITLLHRLLDVGTPSEPVCWKDSLPRGVGTLPNQCPEGQEKDAALCYPLCPSGFYGVGPMCWQYCQPDETDIGALCLKKSGWSYAKKTKGRGVGKPMVCSSDQDYDAGLCYRKCPPKFTGVGPVCWFECAGDLPYDGYALCCTDKKECNDKILSLTLGLPTAIMDAFIAGKDWEKMMEDIKEAEEAILGFQMPFCSKD